MKSAQIRACLWAAIAIALFSVNAVAQNRKPPKIDKARVIAHWTKERRAHAVPRDLVIDARGLGYLRRPDGSLRPHGHDIAPEATPTNHSISPFASRSGGRRGGGGSGDKTPPTITDMDPAAGTTIGESHTFEATVTDASGVKSVDFKIQKDDSTYVNSFPAGRSFGSVWGANFHGFTDGGWKWWVVAKDRAGNIETSNIVNFNVNTGTASVPISHAEWEAGGTVQTAAGRLYFEMPDDPSLSAWSGYVCSATVANDEGTAGRSLIITAAHCVYDDVNKKFARNALFIPNQAGTTSKFGTDLNCNNDPMGCWVPSFGVVDVEWANKTFPDNMAWDYAFYIVPDEDAHVGASASSDALDVAAQSLTVSFAQPSSDFTHALGYSYSEDPKFMYCADNLTDEPIYAANWWLEICGLTGGSSGGPWVQPMDTTSGSGPIVGLNSWGFVIGGYTLPGMAGSKLYGTSALCVFNQAKTSEAPASPAEGAAGVSVSCP